MCVCQWQWKHRVSVHLAPTHTLSFASLDTALQPLLGIPCLSPPLVELCGTAKGQCICPLPGYICSCVHVCLSLGAVFVFVSLDWVRLLLFYCCITVLKCLLPCILISLAISICSYRELDVCGKEALTDTANERGNTVVNLCTKVLNIPINHKK